MSAEWNKGPQKLTSYGRGLFNVDVA